MSPLRLAVVTEGPGDFLILRAIVAKVVPDAEVVPLHPDLSLLDAYPEYERAAGGGSLGAGWRGVRAWCREYGGEDLELLLTAVEGSEYHGLIVHVDASMADKVGAQHPCPPATETTDALRKVVLDDWLDRPEGPAFVIVVIPSKSTDAWVVATYPWVREDIECDKGVEDLLVKHRLLRRRDGRVRKPRESSERFAGRVARQLGQVRNVCGEADRFVDDLQRLVRSDADAG